MADLERCKCGWRVRRGRRRCSNCGVEYPREPAGKGAAPRAELPAPAVSLPGAPPPQSAPVEASIAESFPSAEQFERTLAASKAPAPVAPPGAVAPVPNVRPLAPFIRFLLRRANRFLPADMKLDKEDEAFIEESVEALGLGYEQRQGMIVVPWFVPLILLAVGLALPRVPALFKWLADRRKKKEETTARGEGKSAGGL